MKSMLSDDELVDFPIVSSKPLLGRALKVDQTPLRRRRKALEAYEADVAKLVEENRINLELYYNKYPDRKPS